MSQPTYEQLVAGAAETKRAADALIRLAFHMKYWRFLKCAERACGAWNPLNADRCSACNSENLRDHGYSWPGKTLP